VRVALLATGLFAVFLLALAPAHGNSDLLRIARLGLQAEGLLIGSCWDCFLFSLPLPPVSVVSAVCHFDQRSYQAYLPSSPAPGGRFAFQIAPQDDVLPRRSAPRA
jgi:hypothetical protein